MEIINLSASFQLIATLSIAFVAIEYVKSYTKILCERFFCFQDYVKKSFDECRNQLTDSETLSHIAPIDVGDGKTTNDKVEEVKRKHESLRKEIDEKEEAHKKSIITECEARSLSSMCFFIAIFNILNLLMCGADQLLPEGIFYCGVCCFNALCILYIVLGWILGEKEKPCGIINFSSLKHPIFSIIIIVLLSVICAAILKVDAFERFSKNYWWIVVVIGLVLSYSNYIVFIFKLKIKAGRCKAHLKQITDSLSSDCKQASSDANDLMTTNRIVGSIKSAD